MVDVIRAIRAWWVRRDLAYLELYLRALASQPRPDEAYLRHVRGLIGQAYIRLASFTPPHPNNGGNT